MKMTLLNYRVLTLSLALFLAPFVVSAEEGPLSPLQPVDPPIIIALDTTVDCSQYVGDYLQGNCNVQDLGDVILDRLCEAAEDYARYCTGGIYPPPGVLGGR
jgi:hypothetical protein